MAIELNNRTKILAGVVVLAAVGAGAWFFFLEDFLSEPPPAPAAKSAPAEAPKQAAAAKPAAEAPKPAATAAAAGPGAKPIPSNPDKLIAEVIETSGVIAHFQTLGREAMLRAATGSAGQKQPVTPAEYRSAVEIANRVFEPATLSAEMAAALKADNFDAERMARFLELLRQPIAVTMTAPGMRDVTPEANKEYADSLRRNPPPAARVKLIQTLDDVTHSSEVGADLGGALAREMVDTMLEEMKKSGKNAPTEDRQTVASQLNAIRNQSRAQVRATMYVMYRKASNEELSEYVKLLDTDTGRWGSELLANAIRPLVAKRGGALGREAALLAAARGTAPKEAGAPQQEKPTERAAAPAAAPAQVPGYRRPANIREIYSRYNDLISATVMRDRAAVKELLDDGKNPNVRQSDGITPLMIAASNGDADIATMLLAKGADPNLRAGGRSALSIARARGSSGAATVQLLQRSGAKD